jgi:hypothetical protein
MLDVGERSTGPCAGAERIIGSSGSGADRAPWPRDGVVDRSCDMTSRHLFLVSAAAVMAIGLTACGQREERAPASEPAMSETVAEPAASEAPAAAEAASDVAAVAPAPAADPTGPDPDEVAAAGDTRRRPSEIPPPVAPEQPPQQ